MSNAEHNALANSIHCSFNWGAATQGHRLVCLESTCPAAKHDTKLWSSLFLKKAEAVQQKKQRNMLQDQKQKDQEEWIWF